MPTAPPFAPPWSPAPAIVAEALVAVADPLLTALRPGPAAPASLVAGALAHAIGPEEAEDPCPPWLLPHQIPSFRRALAAVRRHGGALLADPVGSGKTYVALAVAARVNHSVVNRSAPTACLVPAALAHQWQATAARLGVAIALGTHQQASRGRLPRGTRGLVLVDESHHFRHPRTRRYRHTAPWLLDRPALLVTATPLVNRLSDLAHQLRLAVRDGALAADGVPSLRTLVASGCAHPALGRLVIEGAPPGADSGRPSRVCRSSRASTREERETGRLLDLVGRLGLSRLAPVAALVRGTLWRAAGSSPAALAGALRRYRRLLLQARDAVAAGRALGRAELRRFTGGLDEQLVWWELATGPEGEVELALDDLELLDGIIAGVATAAQLDDAKLERLRKGLADGRRTLVFVGRRETVRHLRDRLGVGPLAVGPLAWCTGELAGIGRTTLPRAAVLDWFRAGASAPPGVTAPAHLIATDVGAEGLDLHAVRRVVHYDLPWTPMRLEQREGRAVRLGSPHPEVEVVRFTPPRALERKLGQLRALAGKSGLPAAAGLGPAGRTLWRWRTELAERFGNPQVGNPRVGNAQVGDARVAGAPVDSGVAIISSDSAGALAGYTLRGELGGVATRLASALVWLEPDGRWTEDPATVGDRLAQAAQAVASRGPQPEEVRWAISALTRAVRARLESARGRRWSAPTPEPHARRLTERLHALARTAARRRDAVLLDQLERALRFAGEGHTAGEDALVRRLAEAPEAALRRELAAMPAPSPQWEAIDVALIGLVVFVP